VTGGVFRSDEQRLNPDTPEREHAALIVNRADDEWAKTRSERDGAPKEDEQKCTRSFSNSALSRAALAGHQHQRVDPLKAYAASTFVAGRGS
jgi:hypothetical protein